MLLSGYLLFISYLGLGNSFQLREIKQTKAATHQIQRIWGLVSETDFSITEYSTDSISTLDNKCSRDLYDVLNGTRSLQMWALKMIDSGTKLPSGILEGNIIDLGQFDECVNTERPNYIGQHCQIPITLLEKNGTQYASPFSLTISECVPSTCSGDNVTAVINSILAPLNKAIQPAYAVSVGQPSCFTKEKPPLSTACWIVVCICIVIIVCAIFSTTIDILLIRHKTEISKSDELLRSFSIYNNGQKLLSTKSRSEMGVINGIKFFSMAWVVLGHKYETQMYIPHINALAIEDYYTYWPKMMLFNGTLSVDTFFLVSGLLNAYGFFTLVNKKKSYSIMDLLLSYLHRYLRLTPPYAIMIGLWATVIAHIGNGPLWSSATDWQAQACQRYWWMDLLYINNYFDKANCVGQGWYLGADMQMFWLSPILLYPMWRWPIWGLVELILLTLASIAAPFAISYYYKWTSPLPNTPDADRITLQMDTLYYPTHARTATYIVGIALGVLLYKVRSGDLKISIRRSLNIIGWLVSGVIMLYAIFGGYWFMQANNPYPQISSSFYLAFFRFIWAVGVGWVIFACVTDKGGPVNMLLSWKALWPLARLTYCVFLVHIVVLSTGQGLTKTTTYLNDYSIVEEYFGDLFMSLCWAAILSLLVEAPSMALEKILLSSLTSAK